MASRLAEESESDPLERVRGCASTALLLRLTHGSAGSGQARAMRRKGEANLRRARMSVDNTWQQSVGNVELWQRR